MNIAPGHLPRRAIWRVERVRDERGLSEVDIPMKPPSKMGEGLGGEVDLRLLLEVPRAHSSLFTGVIFTLLLVAASIIPPSEFLCSI